MITHSDFSSHVSSGGLCASLPLSLASACKLKPRPQTYPIRGEFSCDQPRISETLSAHRSDETIKPFQRVIFDVPLVQPPRKFIRVASKMFGADMMKGSIDSALEHGPNGFNAVSAGRASRVFASRMIDGLVTKKQTIESAENHVIVGIELRSDFNLIVDFLCDGLDSSFAHRGKDRASVTFPHPKHSSFTDSTATHAELLMLMLVRFLATYETLVKFYDAFQFGDNFRLAASLAEPMQNEPRGFLRDTYLFRKLKATDALPRCYEQVYGVQPLVKRDFAPLENGSGADGEDESDTSLTAVIARSDPGVHAILSLAFWADWAIRPQTRLQIEPRRFLIGKGLEKLESADSGFAHGLPFHRLWSDVLAQPCSSLWAQPTCFGLDDVITEVTNIAALLYMASSEHFALDNSLTTIHMVIGSLPCWAVRGMSLKKSVSYEFFLGLFFGFMVHFHNVLHVDSVDEYPLPVKNFISPVFNGLDTHVYNSQAMKAALEQLEGSTLVREAKPWSDEEFLNFTGRIHVPQRRLLAKLLEIGPRQSLEDSSLRELLELPDNRSLAGSLSGISKVALMFDIEPRRVYITSTVYRHSKPHRSYQITPEFAEAAARHKWPSKGDLKYK